MLIFDEVVTGFRTSKSGAQGYFGITPDMCTMAKILAGGLPGGAVGGKAEIINMIQFRDDEEFNSNTRIPHNGTYNANPLSAVAGATALGLVANTPVNDTANAMADRLKKGLNTMLSETETLGRATGVASMVFIRLGVDINSDDDLYEFGSAEYKKILDPAMLQQFNLALYSKGLIGLNLISGISACLIIFAYRLTKFRATGISSSGSSVKDTLIVSPKPSSNKVPIPIADFILPSKPSPASVTPR